FHALIRSKSVEADLCIAPGSQRLTSLPGRPGGARLLYLGGVQRCRRVEGLHRSSRRKEVIVDMVVEVVVLRLDRHLTALLEGDRAVGGLSHGQALRPGALIVFGAFSADAEGERKPVEQIAEPCLDGRLRMAVQVDPDRPLLWVGGPESGNTA